MLCIGYAKSATDEGSVPAEATPHPARFAKPPSPTVQTGDKVDGCSETS
jgi:hypothetical protein